MRTNASMSRIGMLLKGLTSVWGSSESTASSQAHHARAVSRRTVGSGSSLRPAFAAITPAAFASGPWRRNCSHASGNKCAKSVYSPLAAARREVVTLLSTSSDARDGYRWAYARASVDPHEPPETSHLSTPRCTRSASMSLIRCSVVLNLISVAAELDELVERMLSKDRTSRPADGGAVVRELEALGTIGGGSPETATRASAGLSGGEQRIVSVMLALVPDEPQRVGEGVRRHGGSLARLANGARLVTLGGRSKATEQVMTAAACALELLEAFPSARIALATRRAITTGGGAPGAAIDQAASLFAQSMAAGRRVAAVAQGLLGRRFNVRSAHKGPAPARPPRRDAA